MHAQIHLPEQFRDSIDSMEDMSDERKPHLSRTKALDTRAEIRNRYLRNSHRLATDSRLTESETLTPEDSYSHIEDMETTDSLPPSLDDLEKQEEKVIDINSEREIPTQNPTIIIQIQSDDNQIEHTESLANQTSEKTIAQKKSYRITHKST